MAFRKNAFQQLRIDDRYNSLTEREKRFADKSWARSFSDYVFPAINEERFSVLYSDNPASRSNTPVNIIIGAMMIKTMFNQTDDEVLESILLDVRYQVALHTTSYESQPVSDRTLSRFRERLYRYQMETGEDLLGDEMKYLSSVYADFLNLNSNIKRMDSMMISTNAKRMSRLEIVYTVNADAIKLLVKTGNKSKIPSELEHYLSDDDKNDVIYHCKDEDASERLQKAITEAGTLKEIMSTGEWMQTSQYRLLLQVLEQQADFDNDGNYIPKDNKQISPASIQNPSDPDATFRTKEGKVYTGYIGNFVETVGEKGLSLITDFDFQKNIYSDSKFAKDHIEKHNVDDEKEICVTDGAYGGLENQKLAEEHGVELIATTLTGKIPDTIFAGFEFNDDGTEIISCPAENVPEKTVYQASSESVRVYMSKESCEHCPNRDRCKAREQKHNYVVNTSRKKSMRAAYLKKLGTEEYLKLTRIRNAVEGIPSVLRRRYAVDHCPHFGLIKTGWTYTLAVGAYNIGKLIKYLPNTREQSTLLPGTT